MKLKEHINNFEKSLLTEVTATGATGTYIGRAGDYIDQKLSGAFHPEINNLKKQLEDQIEGDIAKRMYTDENTPELEQDFIDLEWEYHYDEEEEIDNSKFKNTTGKMQNVGIDINYDKIKDKTEDIHYSLDN